MKISNTIKIKSGKELKLYGGQKHSNKNTIRYFCEHADFFTNIESSFSITAVCF